MAWKCKWQEMHLNEPNFIFFPFTFNSRSLKPLSIDLTSATFPWHRRHSYTFVIKSKNAAGESPNNSTIVVPAWTKHSARALSPQWIRHIYHATNRTSTLSWTPPANQKHLKDYTVFWCQSKHAKATECEVGFCVPFCLCSPSICLSNF